MDNRTSISTTNSTHTSASKSDSINKYESNPNTKKPPTASTSDLRSRPVPSSDLNNYNSRDRYEVKKVANERQSSVGGRPVSASTASLSKVLKTPRDRGIAPQTSTTMTSHLSKSNSQSTTATIKSKSVQQSIQIENPSREESDHDEEEEEDQEEEEAEEEEEQEEEEDEDEGEDEDEEDEEEKSNDNEEEEEEEEDNDNHQEPLQTEDVEDFLQAESEVEKEVLGEPQQRLAEIVKIESLVR